MGGELDTVEKAKKALAEALGGVDNPNGAARALGRVVRRFDPEADTSLEAVRWAAEKALAPYFGRYTKAVVWPLLDGIGAPASGTSGTCNSRAAPDPGAGEGGADRERSERVGALDPEAMERGLAETLDRGGVVTDRGRS